MRRVLVFLPILILLPAMWFGLHFYLWAKLIRNPGLPQIVTPIFAIFAGLWMTLPFLSRAPLPKALAAIVHHAAWTWLGMMGMLVTATFLTSVGRSVLSLVRPPSDPLLAARVQAVIAVTVGAGLALVAWLNTRRKIPVKRVDVAIDNWPAALDGYRIVQLSDVHVSPGTPVEWVQDLVDRANAEKPDLLALTGDLVDGAPDQLRNGMQPFASLKARHGTFFVTGNHEYYSGGDRWIEMNRGLGMRVLQNERITVGEGDAQFELAGVPDWRGGGFGPHHEPRLADTLKGRDDARALVLLAHQPRQFPDAAELGVALQLSGHTHGGQLWPFTYAVRLAEPFPAGHYRRGKSQLYVSRGTGWWGPAMRLGSPMELTVLTLRRSAA